MNWTSINDDKRLQKDRKWKRRLQFFLSFSMHLYNMDKDLKERRASRG